MRCSSALLITLISASAAIAQEPALSPSSVPVAQAVSDWKAVANLVDSQYLPLVARYPWMGIAVGVIRGDEARFYNYGHSDGRGVPTTSDTAYEINSMAKVFTGTVLAELVVEKKVALDDAVQPFIPGHPLPQAGERQITFLDLATHTSGLPRVPANLIHPHSLDPYKDYTDSLFFEFLGQFKLAGASPIGTHYLYSNLGFGLLGYALAQAEHQSFAQMIHHRVSGPLGLNDTTAELQSNSTGPITIGHNDQGVALPPRQGPEALKGSFAIRSTARDLVTLLKAYLHPPHNSLGEALELAQTAARPEDNAGGWKAALGWEIREASGSRFKDGGGGGFNSVMFYNRSRRTGMVVLSNSDFKRGDGIEKQAWNIFTPLRD